MNLPTPTTYEVARDQAECIKQALRSAQLGYDEAMRLLEPRIAIMQERMNQIAKEFGRKPQKINIGHFLRF